MREALCDTSSQLSFVVVAHRGGMAGHVRFEMSRIALVFKASDMAGHVPTMSHYPFR